MERRTNQTSIGRKINRKHIYATNGLRTLLFLPDEIIERVCRRVWLISSPDDAWAFTFRGSDLKQRHVIFLSDELLEQDKMQIRYTILHEVGHVILNHKNSIGSSQTKNEIKRQEREADEFARKYHPFSVLE